MNAHYRGKVPGAGSRQQSCEHTIKKESPSSSLQLTVSVLQRCAQEKHTRTLMDTDDEGEQLFEA